MFVPLHGTEPAGLDPVPVVVGALVAVGIWRAIRRLSLGQRDRSGADR